MFQPDTSGEYCFRCGQKKENLTHSTDPQTYRVSGRDGVYGGQLANGARYRLEINPRANATKIDEEAIPCPTVRKGIDTRWYRGGWQKYLKTKGWVPA